MTTLESPQVAELLSELHRLAAEQHQRGKSGFEAVPPVQRYMAVDSSTGRLLYTLARIGRPENIVEFGTSHGISTCYLAAAVKDNGKGRVIATELLPEKAEASRVNLTRAGLQQHVEIRVGDALITLGSDLPEEIDFVFLDGDKELYTSILRLLKSRLSSNAVIVADNMNMLSSSYAIWLEKNGFLGLEVPFKGGVGLYARGPE